jgi:hypothetical protein
MSYTLEVTFTGLIGLIHPLGTQASPGVLVAPRGVQGTYAPPPAGKVNPQNPKRKALDDKELRRHLTILRVPGDGGFFDESLVYLDGETLQFYFSDASTGGGLTVQGGNYLISLPKVTKSSELDLNRKDGQEPVVGLRIPLDRGSLDVQKGEHTWTIPGTLAANGGAVRGEFAHQAVWTVDGLTTSVKLIRIKGASQSSFTLPTPGEGAKLELRVVNLDAEYALEWETQDTVPSATSDPDFRWYYELLSEGSRGDIKGILDVGCHSLPIPQNPTRNSGAGQVGALVGGGQNCLLAHLGDSE